MEKFSIIWSNTRRLESSYRRKRRNMRIESKKIKMA